MALILAAPRRLSEGERLVRTKMEGWGPTLMLGHRIWGKRLGIVGMGRIGQAIAHRARGFGLSIHYHNRRRVHEEIETELEATYWESLDQMLAHGHHLRQLSPYAGNLPSSERRLRLMTHAYIVNIAAAKSSTKQPSPACW